MKTSEKLALFTAAVAAIGSIVKVFIGTEPPLTSASPPTSVTATNGSLVISGHNQINGVYIQNFQNASDKTPRVPAREPDAGPIASPLVGRWQGTSRYDVPGADLTSSGYSEFLPSGVYNFSGEFTLRNTAKLEPDASIISKVVAAGKWHAEGQKYAITLADLQTVRTVKRRPGQADIDLDLAAFSAGAPPVRLEKAIPKEASQEFALLELGPTSMRSTGRDLPGHRIDYVAIRMP
ncbi:hypothetical protein [Variovorax sp. 770b2]|uniref:hypothetical protein n=1 Tax=Variovorax sp. 770b2 TaxID=1566271 RepID=UPI0008EE81EB|nr:hypothetical protein [Variovorax sp. 770b2]SFQ05257.1 hypothetical protein SAMN03159339_5339 [Variovorax sp. 770b2]